MKRLRLLRKKILPFIMSVAVVGSQIPVMAADLNGIQTAEAENVIEGASADDLTEEKVENSVQDADNEETVGQEEMQEELPFSPDNANTEEIENQDVFDAPQLSLIHI